MQSTPRHFAYPQRNYRHPAPNQWRARPPMQIRPRAFRPHFFNHNSNYAQNGANTEFNGQEHWCETCDRGFPNETLLYNHQKQHQKCNIDGCQFIAHPKIITKHIQMQHSTGLYKKIANLNNPEEIQKWREERKKKYPTKANIEKKMAAVKEKIERGEKMGLDRSHNRNRFENNKNFNSGQKRRHAGFENQPRFKHTKFNNNKLNTDNETNKGTKDDTEKTMQNKTAENKRPQPKPKSYKILPEVENKRQLKPFAGIASIIEDSIVDDTSENDDLIEDDVEINEVVPDNKELKICSALSSLMCDYGSSDEDENTPQELNKPSQNVADKSKNVQITKLTVISEKTPNVSKSVPNELTKTPYIKNIASKQNYNDNNFNTEKCNKAQEMKVSPESQLTPNNVEVPSKVTECNVQSDDDSGPEEVKLDKTEIHNNNVEETKHTKTPVNKKKEFVKTKHFRRPQSRLPSTLLQKLLSKEMQHERNVVLQCVRYIRKNDYFDKRNV